MRVIALASAEPSSPCLRLRSAASIVSLPLPPLVTVLTQSREEEIREPSEAFSADDSGSEGGRATFSDGRSLQPCPPRRCRGATMAYHAHPAGTQGPPTHGPPPGRNI